MSPIDRRALAPLYHQIEQDLLQQIQQGRFRPGDQLPSEAQLSRAYGVSRITARRALENLNHKGLVYSLQGKGSFVAEERIREMSGFRSFSEDIRARGRTASSQVIFLAECQPADDVRARLHLAEGGRVFCLERVRLADDLPVALETAYLPAQLFPGLLEHDLAGSLYDLLRSDYGIHPTWADAEIEAAAADAKAARYLGLRMGEPVLHALRMTYSDTFEVIEFTLSVYRGDRFSFYTGRQFIGS